MLSIETRSTSALNRDSGAAKLSMADIMSLQRQQKLKEKRSFKGVQNMDLKPERRVAPKERKGQFRTLNGPQECKSRPRYLLSKPFKTNYEQHR